MFFKEETLVTKYVSTQGTLVSIALFGVLQGENKNVYKKEDFYRLSGLAWFISHPRARPPGFIVVQYWIR